MNAQEQRELIETVLDWVDQNLGLLESEESRRMMEYTLREVRDDVHHGEEGVGIHMLSSNLYEVGFPLDADVVSKLLALWRHWGEPDSKWACLLECVREKQAGEGS